MSGAKQRVIDLSLGQTPEAAASKDRSLSAQWEHTILVTDTSCEALP